MGKEKKLHKGRKAIKCPKEVGTKATEKEKTPRLFGHPSFSSSLQDLEEAAAKCPTGFTPMAVQDAIIESIINMHGNFQNSVSKSMH